jgi:mono/diheme cytochrome c family protein
MAIAQTPADFFRQNCFSCHTVGGGRLAGPDLKDVASRREREWLVEFILNPQAMISSGDPYAQQLLDEARGVVMPTVPGISRGRAEAVLDMIAEESALEESQFAGSQISDRPFTAADVVIGRELFLGSRSFEGGGPACAACHTVNDLGGLSGGRLGPDLTKVYERIGSRPALAAWLQGPATTTMRPVFSGRPLASEEILPLVAFFEKSAQEPDDDDIVPLLNFFLIGLLGAALALALFDGLWRRRFRAVRRPLVRAN